MLHEIRLCGINGFSFKLINLVIYSFVYIMFYLLVWMHVCLFVDSKQQTLCEPWSCLSNQTCWAEKMPTCAPSECHPSRLMGLVLSPSNPRFILHRNCPFPLHLHAPGNLFDALWLCRCKKKVPATKRFTVHRTSNVLTLSLKRFANFSGGKITKVNKTFSNYLFFVLMVSSH